jgi:hypothetical protein
MQAHAEIMDQAVLEAVDPAVHAQLAALVPGLAHHRCVAHVLDLLQHVELAQPRLARVGRQPCQFLAEAVLDGADAGGPAADGGQAAPRRVMAQGVEHPAAAVVAADDDVAHLKHLDREGQHGGGVGVAQAELVGDVAVDEDLARWQADDLVGRDAGVRTADPQVGGDMLGRQPGEIVGVHLADGADPFAVVDQQLLRRLFHGVLLRGGTLAD